MRGGGGGEGGLIIGCTASKSYMKGIIEKLTPVKAVACDFMSQRLLRLSAPVITQPPTKLINHFIPNRLWPSLRYGRIATSLQYLKKLLRLTRLAIVRCRSSLR